MAAQVDGASSELLVDRVGGLPTVVDEGQSAFLHAEGPLAEIGSSTTYPLEDGLGSVRGMTDGSGELVGSRSYEAFGAPRAGTGAASFFGFTGEPTDATGLVYLRARYLDPGTGRMLSADTVRPNAPGTQGHNLSAYVANNPTTWVDPTGHFAQAPTLPMVLAALEGAWGFSFMVPILVAFLVIILFFILMDLYVTLIEKGLIDLISPSSEGKRRRPIEDARDAVEKHPPLPEPEPSPVPLPFPPNPGSQPRPGETVYRVYGGHAQENGWWWTPMDPRTIPNYGDAAELPLPPRNTCERLVAGPLINPAGVTRVNVKPSGLVEYVIPNAREDVSYPRVYHDLDPGEVCGNKWAA